MSSPSIAGFLIYFLGLLLGVNGLLVTTARPRCRPITKLSSSKPKRKAAFRTRGHWPAFVACLALFVATLLAGSVGAQTVLPGFLSEVPAGELAPGADSYGTLREDTPVAPILKAGETIGWAFITSDFVGTTGYSSKPIHTLVALGPDARVIGARLVKHSEPIVLVGIPEAEVRDLIAGYVGRNLAATDGGTTQDLDIISGATVTVMVIDDSIRRAGLKVARALGLGGLAEAVETGPSVELNPDAVAASDWATLVGDGTIRRLSLDVEQINAAFAATPDPRAATRALADPPEATFIDMYTTLASIPQIGTVTLGEAESDNLRNWLDHGEHAILVTGRGLFSFKGSGYVRGGIFDRIQLIQDDVTILFHDRDHRRLNRITTPGAPALTETDLFRIPADSGFDPTQPWRLQLLVSRDVAATEKVFITFDLGWQPPASF